ncbi:P-loop ATPase, Sll1717 family [Falsiroseomonas sp.]|uniref:P-loop ATPase, Sll1717 family n=1 Tax=Falsiroseomonas sp. TaxID=2870721 RepID=UPI0034A218E0
MDVTAEGAVHTFEDFYKRIGFDEYPFSVFTSELEREYRERLFVDIAMYGPVTEGFRIGRTMILSGDRGTGKTAIIFDFIRQIDSRKICVVNIDDFGALKENFSSADFYRFIIEKISDKFFDRLGLFDRKLWKFNNQDRQKLAFFYQFLTRSGTKRALEGRVRELQSGVMFRLLNPIYKILRVPLNFGVNAAVNIITDVISSATGAQQATERWREFFPESLNDSGVLDFANPEANFRLLKELVTLVRKAGYERVTLVFDKVDEDQRFNNSAEDISDYIEKILTDNRLLTDEDLQVIFSVWSIPFGMIKHNVRTHKIFCPTIDWSAEDLMKVLEKRLSVFSGGKIVNISDMLDVEVSEDPIKEMILLANKNPRDLWHILDKALQSQFSIDSNSKKISIFGLRNGMERFVREFNFFEYYPRKSNARANSMDVYAYITHLLKLDGVEFTRNKLNDMAQTGGSTANYVTGMEGIGLIQKIEQISGSSVYRIRDPKVVFALNHRIELSRPS